jgi:hypothetical protein
VVVNPKILEKIKELIGDSAPTEVYEMFEEILEQQAKYDEMDKEEEDVKKFYAGILELSSKNEIIMKHVGESKN